LLGNKFTKVSLRDGIASCLKDESLTMLTPFAISKKELTNKALMIANAVVNR